MERLLKLFFFGFIGCFLLCANAFAACYGSSPNLTAASASRSDVADCVAVSTYGDTINIPACAAGSCTWSSGITITKDVKIVGAGIGLTTLSCGFTDDSIPESFFKFVPDQMSRERLSILNGAGTFEVAGFTFTSDTRKRLKYAIWIENRNLPAILRVKIHNNKFERLHRAVRSLHYTHGVFYNNQLIDTNANYPRGAGHGPFTNDRMALGSGKGWYIEDNTFHFTGIDGGICGAGNDGGGYVVRYNTVTGSLAGTSTYFETHGNQPGYIYGPQITEIYGNYITATGPNKASASRGGKNIYLNNVMAVGRLSIWEEFSDLATSPTYPAGRCPENQGGSRQTCSDSCVCQKVHDSYFINNRATLTGAVHNAYILPGFDFECRWVDNKPSSAGYCKAVTANNPLELVENIEFFNYVPSGFNGTSGVGCGTLANRPATCIKGVGYWATEQSCSNLTGMVGANPATPISGTLYKCVETNTWAEWYKPYTYPHPLRSGSTTTMSSTTTTLKPTTTITDTSTTAKTSSSGPIISSEMKTKPKRIKIFNR